ncbi:hypothetical protein LTR91_021407 [Friedmanniomyces endolithicus]|uniref:Uncharacterized protein n=1 Tax=Friedmanniomyces endolithicus TaxID=329885 RepID=A0AAN6K4J8_9PEZI|nr:hypothetical protein LTR57_012199 [Friedmanniomyces endolithicus]KAK0958267.1 hypothetical protein LTR91_021407 [Friedmanniomyces endolithicus]KAK1025739.1 hypothetical protein LTS16_022926 [Friedmanniomyces endolithicus]
MRDRRNTVGGCAFEAQGAQQMEVARPSDGEAGQRPRSRLQRMRSTIFGGDGRDRTEERAQSSSRRSTLVEAMWRPQRSLFNVLGRRDDGARPHASEDDNRGYGMVGSDDGESISTVRPIDRDREYTPRESVEQWTNYGSSLYSDNFTDTTDSDTIRRQYLGGPARRLSNGTASTVDMSVGLRARTLRRTSEFWRRSVGNLRQTAFLDSLRDVETPGQTANEAFALLNGGVEVSTAVAAQEPSVAEMEASRRSRTVRGLSSASTAAPGRFSVAESDVAVAKRRNKLSALSMSNLLSKIGLRGTDRPAAAVEDDEAISPKTAVPKSTARVGRAEAFSREYRALVDVHAAAYGIYENSVLGDGDSARPSDTGTRNDSAAAKASAEVTHKATGSAGPATASKTAAARDPAVEAEIAHLERMLQAKPDMASTRSRSSTLECELAFDPQWRPDDPRGYSRRHHLSRLFGSEPVDPWELNHLMPSPPRPCVEHTDSKISASRAHSFRDPVTSTYWPPTIPSASVLQGHPSHTSQVTLAQPTLTLADHIQTMPTCLPLTALFTHIRTAYQARKNDAKQHRAAIHAQRDRERRTVGLLEIALRSQQGSIDSLTAADPGVFFKIQADTGGRWLAQTPERGRGGSVGGKQRGETGRGE